MEKEKAQAIFEKWKERLDLDEWRVDVALFCHPDYMGSPDALGATLADEVTKTAVIHILDEKYSENPVRPYNFERVVVHELLHLKFCLLEDQNRSSLQYRLLHQIIDDLARAFVPEEDEAPSEGEGEQNA